MEMAHALEDGSQIPVLSSLFVRRVWREAAGEGFEGCFVVPTLQGDLHASLTWKCSLPPRESCRVGWSV